mgnify:CR=1 FL=1
MKKKTAESIVSTPEQVEEMASVPGDLFELADILISVYATLQDQSKESPDGESSDLCSSQHERAG